MKIVLWDLADIEKLCQSADDVHHKYFFDTIIKTAKNKAFQDWPDDGYALLKSAVHFARDQKQAQKILEIFPLLGTLYDGRPYPDQLLITFDICREALKENVRGYFNRRPPWAYYLERLYMETKQQEKLLEIVRFILFQRDTSYFQKLKEIYMQQGIWEEQREPLWQELSKTLADHEYALRLSQNGEVHKLLDVVKRHPSYVFQYGKQLAGRFPAETYAMFEACILKEAQEATDRRKYRQACRMIKEFAAGAKENAIEIIDRLAAMYPRRPAMLEELAGLKKRLGI